jgi:hypothetical protein
MKVKKIIAREFLLLLAVVFLIGLIYSGFRAYNLFKKIKVELVKKDLTRLEDSYQNFLSKPLKPKDPILDQICLNKMFYFQLNNGEIEDKTVFYNKFPQLKKDSVLLTASFDYAATIQSRKHKSRKEINMLFPEFFIINQSDVDSLKHYTTQIEVFQNEILKFNDSKISSKQILNYLYILSCIILIILFGLRYLFYSIKWSIQTLKSNE